MPSKSLDICIMFKMKQNPSFKKIFILRKNDFKMSPQTDAFLL